MEPEVDAEWPVSALPHLADPQTQLVRRESQPREDAEAARPGDFSDQVGPGHVAHAGLEDRVLDSQQITEHRVECHALIPLSACLRCPCWP